MISEFERFLKNENLKFGSGVCHLDMIRFFEEVAKEARKLRKKDYNFTYDDDRQRDADQRVEPALLYHAFFNICTKKMKENNWELMIIGSYDPEKEKQE